MADRRRRRKIKGSEESEEISDSSEEEHAIEKPAELESSVESHAKVAALSEYGSAEDEDEEENSDLGHVCHIDEDLGQELENPAEEEGGQESTADPLEGEYIEDDEEWKDEQREEGDGEESEIQHAKEKILDFDEDRRNPQYIPKKGGFYEHDDRLTEVVVEEQETKKIKGKKKLWKDDGKWMHDRYQEDDQNPKSRDELIALYGYDIRNEDGPPRARRRRRYGRGPSKYTRKWEDEDAYGKMLMQGRGKRGTVLSRDALRGRGRGRGFGRGGQGTHGENLYSEEFPKLGDGLDESDENQTVDDGTLNGLVGSDQRKVEEDVPDSQSVVINTNEGTSVRKEAANILQSTVPSGDQSFGGVKPARGKSSTRRNYGRPPRARYIGSSRPPTEDAIVTQIADDFERITVNDSRNNNAGIESQGKESRKEAKIAPTPHNSCNGPHERRQATVPPRLQDSVASRPKRYSSQRQRQVSDNLGYQQNSTPPSAPLPPRYYDAANYQQPGYRDHSGTNNSPQNTTPMLPPPSFQAYEGAPYQEAYTIRPMASPPRMFTPVSLPTGQPVIPAPYIAPGGTMMNYGPPPATYTQFQFQYPAPPPPPPPPVGDPLDNTLSALQSQPQEIFRGGMAYYNAQPPVRTLPKRPRAAIPIVPPPEMEEQRRDENDNPHEPPSYDLPHQEQHAVHVEN